MMTKNFLAALPAAAALLNGAAAAPANQKRCIVNAQHIDTWTADGLNRRQVAFSTEGALTDDYCKWWDLPNELSYTYFNPRCYYHEDYATWVVDASFFKGPLGDQEFRNAMDDALKDWIELSGCSTG